MKKKLSKTGQMLLRTPKAQLYREYKNGYQDGSDYYNRPIQTAPNVTQYGWSEAYRDGFVDGYNDNLECMRIE